MQNLRPRVLIFYRRSCTLPRKLQYCAQEDSPNRLVGTSRQSSVVDVHSTAEYAACKTLFVLKILAQNLYKQWLAAHTNEPFRSYGTWDLSLIPPSIFSTQSLRKRTGIR
jgi:hypothetical protein